MPNKPTGFRIISRILFCVLSIIIITSLMLQSSWALDFHVKTSKERDLSNVRTYAFAESGSYMGLNAVTDASGTAVYDSGDFTDGNYKFRTDYLGSQFWSPIISMPGTSYVKTVIEEETVEVLVTTASGPAEGIRVYLFSGSDAYLGQNETTGATGKVQFDLPVGEDFKFRADMLGMQYWSSVTTIAGGVLNQVSVDAGGGLLEFIVDKGSGIPIAGIKVYLFNLSGTYLGLNQTTDSSGMVGFDVSEGDYKVRMDYLGSQFWSQEINVIQNTSITHTIPHQDVTITVGGIYQEVKNPIQGIKVYLFTASGVYQSQYQVSDTNGEVLFNLPEQAYKVRADYLGQQFWFNDFTWQDVQVDIPMAEAEITVSGAGQPLEEVNVYVFTGSGSYLIINDTTDVDGKATFRLPAGDYKFRADYQGSQY